MPVRKRQPTHLGGILKRHYLEPLTLTITEVADEIGVSRKTLSKIINERGSITPDMALRLSKPLLPETRGGSSGFGKRCGGSGGSGSTDGQRIRTCHGNGSNDLSNIIHFLWLRSCTPIAQRNYDLKNRMQEICTTGLLGARVGNHPGLPGKTINRYAVLSAHRHLCGDIFPESEYLRLGALRQFGNPRPAAFASLSMFFLKVLNTSRVPQAIFSLLLS